MPIRIPSTLYSGGRAVIDTTPFVKAVVKDIANKKAAKEAVVKHADDLYKGLNPAGVRAQDMYNPEDPTKGINADINSWYNEAKAGNLDFGKYKELLYNIERSKQIGKEQLEIGQLTQQGKLEPNSDDIAMLDAKDKSIYSASHKDHKIGELSPFVPDLDESKFYTAVIGAAKPQENVGKKTFDAATGRYFIPKEFTKQEEKNFADVAGSLVAVDKSVKKEFSKQIANPAFLKDAVPAYISVYGVDAIPSYKNNGSLDDFTPDKAAAAAAILRARQMKDVVSYDKPKEDTWKKELDYKAYLKGKGRKDAEGVVNKFINDRFEEGKKRYKPGTGLSVSNQGKKYNGYEIDLPLDIRSKYTIDKGFATEQIPDSFIMTVDKKKIIPIFYKKDEKGKVLLTETGNKKINSNINANPIDVDIFKVDLGQVLVKKSDVGEEAIYGDEQGYQPGTTGASTKEVKVTKSAKYD